MSLSYNICLEKEIQVLLCLEMLSYEPRVFGGLRPGKTQTSLLSYRS